MNDRIKKLITEQLAAIHIELIDDSAKHAGHKEAQQSGGGHYSILVVSNQFCGKTLIERHRMIYQALESVKEGIHALAIKALTKEEFQDIR